MNMEPRFIDPVAQADASGALSLGMTLVSGIFPWVCLGILGGMDLVLPGRSVGTGPVDVAVLVVFAALQLPAALWTRHLALTTDMTEPPPAVFASTMLSSVFLIVVAWYGHPVVATAAVLCLVLGASQITQYWYDSWAIRSIYLLIWPVADLLLLGVDAAGGRGLIHGMQVDPDWVITFVCLQLMVLGMVQMLLSSQGQQARQLDAWMARTAALEQAEAASRREQAILGHTGSVLAQGLAASRFSHDVRSPMSVVRISLDLLREHLAEGDVASCTEILDDLDVSAEQLVDMCEAMALSISRPDQGLPRAVAEWVADGRQSAARLLRAEDRELPEVSLDLAPGEVRVTSGHGWVLSTLLVNSVRHGGGTEIVLVGRETEAGYRLSLRDHGVSGAERERALARLRERLEPDVDEPDEPDEPVGDSAGGYGIALRLARMLVVRHGGALSARAPDRGPGVQLDLTLAAPRGSEQAAARMG